MLQKNKLNIIYRIICCIAFLIVIIYVDSFITLSLLAIAFYLLSKNMDRYGIVIEYFATILLCLIGFITKNIAYLQAILIIDYVSYFVMVSYYDVSDKDYVVNYNLKKYFIRFKKLNRKDIDNSNMINTVFVTLHLGILFLSILVG